MADINLGNGGDTTTGTPDDDVIAGGNGADTISGGAGNDIISGGNGNDIIEGGLGSDTLSGGRGDDKFVFTFGVSSGPIGTTFAQFAASQNIQLVDGQLSQNQFSTAYTSWLSKLILDAGLGTDIDGDGIISFGLNQNDASSEATPFIEGMSAEDLQKIFGGREDLTVKTGKTTQERYYSDLADGALSITSHDGTDKILDFRGQSMGSDTLQFKGIADLDQFKALFTVSKVDIDNDGKDDTVIGWNGGSLTLLGQGYESADQLANFLYFG